MPKISTHTTSKEHEHDVKHAHVDFVAKTLSYQLAEGAPVQRSPLPEHLAEELLALIGEHAQSVVE